MINMERARSVVADFQTLLDATPPEAAHVRPEAEAWTLSEIVGHLIDSASNNHQRFVRLRFGDLQGFPAYEPEPWVQAQQYDGCDFAMLKTLWSSYNALLLHLAACTPQQAKPNAWHRVSDSLTLEFIVADYYEHLQLHVEHYARRLAEVQTFLAHA